MNLAGKETCDHEGELHTSEITEDDRGAIRKMFSIHGIDPANITDSEMKVAEHAVRYGRIQFKNHKEKFIKHMDDV